MSDADSGDTRLEIQTRIAEMVIDCLLVPMIVAGHIDLDRAIDRLERGVAVALGDTGEAKRLLGQHIQRSERWIHEKLKAARDAAADASSQTEKSGAPGEAQRLMREILLAYAEQHPNPLGVDEVYELLRQRSRKVNVRNLSGTLELYARLGFLRPVGGAPGKNRYIAVDPLLELKVPRGALEKLSERLSSVPSLALSYCLGRGEFGGVAARLHPLALQRARERLKDAVAGIMAEALKETQLSDEPSSANLEVSAIFAVGTVGAPNGSVHTGRGSHH